MLEASVMINPLKPSSVRSNFLSSSGDKVAGLRSLSAMSGQTLRSYYGSRICPAMIQGAPLSISV